MFTHLSDLKKAGLYYAITIALSVALIAYFHAAFNSFLDIFTSLTLMTSPLAIYIVGEGGMLTLLATVLAAAWLVQRRQASVKPSLALDEPIGKEIG